MLDGGEMGRGGAFHEQLRWHRERRGLCGISPSLGGDGMGECAADRDPWVGAVDGRGGGVRDERRVDTEVDADPDQGQRADGASPLRNPQRRVQRDRLPYGVDLRRAQPPPSEKLRGEVCAVDLETLRLVRLLGEADVVQDAGEEEELGVVVLLRHQTAVGGAIQGPKGCRLAYTIASP